MARQHFAHLGDKLGFLAGELRRARLAPLLVGDDRGRGLGALDQVLDLHLAARLLVAALDDHARRVAPVGIFQLVAHVLGVAEIELGADVCIAQAYNHLLIVRDAVAIEHGDDHGAEFGPRIELAEQRQRRLQPRYADREAGCRHDLAAETRDKTVIAPAAADGAEHDRLPLLVRYLREKLRLEDRTGVIFEAADDGRINVDLIRTITGRPDQPLDLFEL